VINLSFIFFSVDRPESMELCFTSEGNYRDALTDAQANQAGDMTDMQGNKIGTHKGIANYALGQRRGIGFAGGVPLYVGRIDARTNTIVLGTGEEVGCHLIKANQFDILIPEVFLVGSKLFGEIRSYGDPRGCKLIDVTETGITVEFNQPQFAPSPGQKPVLYDRSDNIIAGGTILAKTAALAQIAKKRKIFLNKYTPPGYNKKKSLKVVKNEKAS